MLRKLWMLMVMGGFGLAACASTESQVAYEDLPASGDAANGQALYEQSVNNMPACSSCHMEGASGAPPLVDLEAYAAAAGERVPGQSAREYTFYAIAEPDQHIVEGYGNAMYNRYDDQMTPQQLADLVAYLLSE